MAEYIERETFLKDIEKRYCLPCKEDGKDYNGCMCRACWVDYMLCNVIGAPAADVAPVVRCRDCKYYRVSAMLAPNKFCFRLKHPVEDRPIGYNFAPDDFCSHGERLGEVKSDAEKD